MGWVEQFHSKFQSFVISSGFHLACHFSIQNKSCFFWCHFSLLSINFQKDHLNKSPKLSEFLHETGIEGGPALALSPLMPRGFCWGNSWSLKALRDDSPNRPTNALNTLNALNTPTQVDFSLDKSNLFAPAACAGLRQAIAGPEFSRDDAWQGGGVLENGGVVERVV